MSCYPYRSKNAHYEVSLNKRSKSFKKSGWLGTGEIKDQKGCFVCLHGAKGLFKACQHPFGGVTSD